MVPKQFFVTHKRKILVGAPIVFLLLLNTGNSILAAGNAFILSPETTAFASVGDSVPVDLEMITKVAVNAVGGTVDFDPTIVQADSVTRNTSTIDLWSEEPLISNTNGTIHWSGGIVAPSKASDNHGMVFVINFRALKTGKTRLTIKDGQLLADNGEGTNMLSGANTLTVYVRDQGRPSPDVNNDGVLSISDLNTLYLQTFRAYNPRYDLNGDNKVDWNDVKALLDLF